MKTVIALLAILLIAFSNQTKAVVNEESELFLTIKKMDDLLFEKGFNQCELDVVNNITHEELNFYHDINGIKNKAGFLKAFKESLCSSPNRKPIRKLVESSMQVFKLENNGEVYGAIQRAEHEFYIKEPNKELYITNIAKFSHVWILEGKQWKLKESLSFEHRVPEQDFLTPEQSEKFNTKVKTPLFDQDAQINKLLKQHKIPSIGIGYINQGKLQQVRMFGNKTLDNAANDSAITKDSIYKVASLTKPVVAVLALKLVEQGLWELDTPIGKYYQDPDLLEHANSRAMMNKLTTRHILSHQTGFKNWRYLDPENKLKFEFEPGEQFQYSGEGFEYLRKALEVKFKKPLEQLAKEEIFQPLSMDNTYFYWSESINEEQYAVEHDENGQPIKFEKYQQANAAANLMTTIEDYSRFMVHTLNGAGLSDKLYREMLSKQVKVSNNIDFGLGWKLFNNLGNNEYAVQHTGGDYGTKTLAILLPSSKRGVVVFANSENGMVVWRKIIEEYFGEVGKALFKANMKE